MTGYLYGNESLGERWYPTTSPHFKFKSANAISPSAQVRFHADTDSPTDAVAVAVSDKFLEVNVEGEWGLVCFAPLSRSVLTVLCRDLEGTFGQWSRPGTPRYYSGRKRCECHCRKLHYNSQQCSCTINGYANL